jgi:hypothetical protein
MTAFMFSFTQELEHVLIGTFGAYRTSSLYGELRRIGLLREAVGLLGDPSRPLGLLALSRLANTQSTASDKLPLVADLLELNFLEPFLKAVKRHAPAHSGTSGDHLLGMMQLLVMVCADPRGAVEVVKIRGACALLLSLANKAERTQRRAGLKALSALARSAEDAAVRKPLRDLGALQLFAQVFLDDEFMSEQERPDPSRGDSPNPNSWWAAHGLCLLVGLPPKQIGTPNRSKAEERFLTASLAAVSKTGALSRILGVAVDPSHPAQAYAAAACGFLAGARESSADFEGLRGVRELVTAFAATAGVDAGTGLLNIMYGLVKNILPQLLDDGLVRYIAAWLRRKDLKSPHIISACKLLNQVFVDERSVPLAEEARLEEALRQHTSEYNHTDAAMAAKQCLTCLEMKRSPGGLQIGMTFVHAVKQLVKVKLDGPLDGTSRSTGPRNGVSYEPVTDEEMQENL